MRGHEPAAHQHSLAMTGTVREILKVVGVGDFDGSLKRHEAVDMKGYGLVVAAVEWQTELCLYW